ncbi:small subunit of terminase [Enterococcus faecalis]|uniref:phage terminase small subunit n=1 Tax=Enterococcus faecalis TaxID=1351 RepID=UPI000CF1E267|nr:phage terminase small subunit [Enterococcus faecalis]EGO2634689.1 small subunit of terminase [Enterococcus faecalis]EGO5090862.1 small subunit of terminase [Enterococcus faecalis]EGO6786346.1 small subunit of terminase [Enterococcus faecalis]EGO8806179.1 small subunit of terminase [Enterococcus faecalis]EHZ5380264.1 small subunit of terminase [Enterococcus faecalis]
MARKRDPRRDEAKKIWLDSGGKKVLKELASELNVSDSQIRKWKSVDKWADKLKGNVTKSNSNVTNKSGAPPGNKNAKGNKGGSPPKGNKNAIKTGEYETIFADMLSDEEKDIYSNLNDDPFFILNDEIRLLKVRQFRMMKRIKEAEKGLNDEEVERLQQLRKIKTPVEKDGRKLEIKREVMQDVQVTRKTFRKLDDILAIEDSLTRVSNQLTKSIKQLNELSLSQDKKVMLNRQNEKLAAEIRRLKIQNGDDIPEVEDDGFIAAINNIVNDNEVWNDDNIET